MPKRRVAFCAPARALLLASALLGGCERWGTGPEVGDVVWRTRLEVDGGAIADPILADSLMVFVLGPGVRALRVRDGTEVWRSAPLRAPALASGTYNLARLDSVVLTAFDDQLVALSLGTGREAWRLALPEPDSTREAAVYSETYADARSIVTSRNAHIHHIDPGTRTITWSRDYSAEWWGRGSAKGFVASGDTLFVTMHRPQSQESWLRQAVVLALDRGTGRELWRFAGDSSSRTLWAAPVLAASAVLALDLDGRQLSAHARRDGSLRWRVQTEPGFMGPFAAVVRDGIVFVASGDTYVYAVDVETGAVRWRTSTGASNYNVALCGRRVLVEHHGWTALDAGAGRVVATGGYRDGDDYVASGFAVRDGIAYATGGRYAEAFRCE